MTQEYVPDPRVVALLGDICLDLPKGDRESYRDISAWLLADWPDLKPQTAKVIVFVITSARVGSYLKAVRNTEKRLESERRNQT